MRPISKCIARLAMTGLFVVTVGCSDRPKDQSPQGTIAMSGRASQDSPFGENDGYWHWQSGTGFRYADGWDNLGVTVRGSITSLGLRKADEVIEVTLYWSALDSPINAETIGEAEWTALSPLYGDKLGRPEPVAVQSKSGFRMKVRGLPGEEDPVLVGVIYVFAVKSGEDLWKIKLRATARGDDKLQEAEKLLENYRW